MIGSKTNLLYNNLNTTDFPGQNRLESSFLESFHLDGIISPYPEIDPFSKDIKKYCQIGSKNIPLRIMDRAFYSKVYQLGESRPYTGVIAILDLLRYQVEEIFITGMDFYHTGYYRGYRTIDNIQKNQLRKNDIHDAEKQEKMLRWIYLKEKRLKADSILKKILLEPWLLYLQSWKKKYDNWIYSNNNISSLFQKKTFPFFENIQENINITLFNKSQEKFGNIETGIWIPYSSFDKKKLLQSSYNINKNILLSFQSIFLKMKNNIKEWWIPISSAFEWFQYHSVLTTYLKNEKWDGNIYYLYFAKQNGNQYEDEFKKMMELKIPNQEIFITLPFSWIKNNPFIFENIKSIMSESDLITIILMIFFLWNLPKNYYWILVDPWKNNFEIRNYFEQFLRVFAKLEYFYLF